MTAVFLGIPTAPAGVGHLRGDQPFPDAARDALARRPAAAQPRPRHRHHPRQAGGASSARCPTGRSCARPARRSRPPRWPGSTSTWYALEAAGHRPRRHRALGPRRRRGQPRSSPDLVRATGADEVVKVKSMATQEIGLNEALEAAGIAAHETDLAELIVQLGDDKPSHILVPAIHRNRAEIREIFLRDDARRRPGAHRRPAAAGHGGPRAPARALPPRPGGDQRAPTSPSPRPARSPSSSPRATAGCA